MVVRKHLYKANTQSCFCHVCALLVSAIYQAHLVRFWYFVSASADQNASHGLTNSQKIRYNYQ